MKIMVLLDVTPCRLVNSNRLS